MFKKDKDIILTAARSGGDFADNFPVFTYDPYINLVHETYRFYTRSTEYHNGAFQKYICQMQQVYDQNNKPYHSNFENVAHQTLMRLGSNLTKQLFRFVF